MAFIVEDGTGVPDANAYIDVAFFEAYFADRGVTFAELDAEIQTWIVQATDYIETVFATRFVGTRNTDEQSLSWPRTDAVNIFGVDLADDSVPVPLMRACAEYARRAKDGPLMPDPTIDATGFSVVTTRKKVGPIEKEFTVMGSSGQPILVRSYPTADGLLTSLLRPGVGGTRVIR